MTIATPQHRVHGRVVCGRASGPTRCCDYRPSSTTGRRRTPRVFDVPSMNSLAEMSLEFTRHATGPAPTWSRVSVTTVEAGHDRWAMVADLRRCIGARPAPLSCRHTNATPPDVQWRRVLDMEFGEYPDVHRAFVPVGCQHCDDPPCMTVCPSKATKQRADGIVTIDYDLCIGCGYCAVACPYQARYKTSGRTTPTRVDGERNQAPRRRGSPWRPRHVLRRRIDADLPWQQPGVDPEATPRSSTRHHESNDLRRPRHPQASVAALERSSFPDARGRYRQGVYYLWASNELRTESRHRRDGTRARRTSCAAAPARDESCFGGVRREGPH